MGHFTSSTVGTPEGELPVLCPWIHDDSLPADFPGLNFCPAPAVEYMVKQHKSVAPSISEDSIRKMFYLDAMFMLSVIKAKHPLSLYVVNLGANPSSVGETQNRVVIQGDDTTALNFAGWKSVNYDVPEMASTTKNFFDKFEGAQLDTSGKITPSRISGDLQERGVPVDVDFLKIDIDSFECDYLEEILSGGFQPKVIDVELASSYPPPIRFRANFVPDVSVAVTPFSGCSLQEAVDLLRPHGYTLVQYPLEDGWFVRDEYLKLFGPLETDPRTLFYRGNPSLYGVWQMFKGMEGAFDAVRRQKDPEAIISEIKIAHDVAFALRPDLKGRLKYKLDIAGTS